MSATTDKAELFNKLCRMEQELAATTDSDELLSKILACSKELTGSEEASILLHDEERHELFFNTHQGEMGEIVEKIRIPLDRPSIAGHTLKAREAQIINDVANDPRHFKGVDQATQMTTRSILAVPIIWGDRVYGVIEAINKAEGGFTEDDREMLGVLAAHAAIVLNNLNLMQELQNFFVHTLEILVSAMESVEPFTDGHVIRLTRLATGVARRLGLEGKEYETLWYGAYFHDIGKLLLGASFVSKGEKQHPVIGANMMRKIKILEKTVPLVRHHHERWNGTGYPDRLAGDQIPLGARILALAEDYEEQMMARPSDMTLEKFREEFFETITAKQLHDPELIPIFKEVSELVR